ncbi:Diguanylate cyclase DosC [bacterium HR12]|nr:Diguanylate cyclase DosC [bacterium HR12]
MAGLRGEVPIDVLAVGPTPAPEGEGLSTERAETLQGALDRLDERGADVALVALSLGPEAIRSLRERVPELPVVAVADDAEAVVALEAGAHDVIPPGADPATIRRSIRYAISLHRLERELHRHRVVDELTGLYNARGFEQLAEHHLRLADRTQEPVVLVFVRLNDLTRVSETHGAAEGPRLLAETAEVLRQAVRDSDVLARVGTDAFCVLLTGNAAGAEAIVLARLVEAVAARNARSGRTAPLSLSVGAARYDPADPVPLAELMTEASRRLQAPG